MPAEVSIQPQDPKEGDDAEKLKATRQGMYHCFYGFLLLTTLLIVEFYFADSNLPYDK